ncbi:DnaB-like helicase N-terminal domain-containing protein [Aggregatibacter actinomycetemcomitans]|uniref:DnaB-like helicase N-terminal domain-containing protein n=1 Tax=Aggregatibacter actinomycetemcomitans TaxID=714 RepID=UPI001E4A5721|nr:DnaB-like helicase N-terminal domain-containing protein [Aggregatibacter actinomycetemcomitans]
MENLKIVPYNLGAEQCVLGALMFGSLSKDALVVLDFVKPESFYRFEHQHIFAEIQALAKNNQPIDLMTVESRLFIAI